MDFVVPVYGAVSLRHDGHVWTVVDQAGLEMHRTDDIPATDPAAAQRWMHHVTSEFGDASGAPPARRRVRRLSVGVFPDGSYGDSGGRLGPQRARRAWNWALDRLGL